MSAGGTGNGGGPASLLLKATFVGLGAGVVSLRALFQLLFKKRETVTAGTREKLREVEAGRMVFVIDFDRTISARDSSECHHLIGTSTLMPKEFRERFDVLIDNPNIVGTKWWTMAHDLIVEYETTQKQIHQMVESAGSAVYPRPGIDRLLSICKREQIPVLVVSAGIQDFIEKFLRLWGFDHENVRVSSNKMIFCGQGKAVGFADPMVTSRNKRLTFSRNKPFFDEHKAAGRDTYVIIGDSPRDAAIAKEMPGLCVTFGFCDGLKSWARDEDYVDAYDYVIRDGCADLIVEEIKAIISRGS